MSDENLVKNVNRRHVIGKLGLLGAAPLLSCGSDTGTNVTGSADASLGSLTLSTITLSPVFAADTTAYSVSVPNSMSSVTVTATPAGSGASVTVNGTAVASGVASGPITLGIGANTITVLVTAANGTTTRVYAVSVNRASIAGTACVVIPQETIGPYPLSSLLNDPAVMKSDIRADRTGVPLTLMMSLVNVNNNCAALTNAAVYVWHCDKDGNYSGYGAGAGATYLRGVQITDANGQVTFRTIYPGWYAGRITHFHFEVFLNASLTSNARAISQIAFPPAVTSTVYASSLYAARGQNTSVATFAADMVFADGTAYQLATVTGDVASGYSATLTVGVAG